MKKRFLRCGLLCLALLVLLCGAVSAKEAGALQTSEACISFIKDMEGFSQYAYWDYQQWTIGYGTACEKDAYPDGISQEEAEIRLRSEIEAIELRLEGFLRKNNIAVSQNQYDALVSFTFNVGSGWTDGCKLRTYLEAGTDTVSVNQLASAFGIWCHSGENLAVDKILVSRRIREVQMFLYGDYTGLDSPSFIAIVFDGAGGSVDMDVRLYQQGEPFGELSEAQREDGSFLGWHTQPEGGTAIGEATIALKSMTLYAQWAIKEPVSFTDVKETDWFSQYVLELAEAEVIRGYGDGSFRPENTVTTAEALKLILLSAGVPEQAPSGQHWASGYGAYAVEAGFLTAQEAAALDQPISRQLVCRIAAGALSLSPRSQETVFADTQDEHILALYQAGIINGYTDGTFRPAASLKRSEISAIVWRIKRYAAEAGRA